MCDWKVGRFGLGWAVSKRTLKDTGDIAAGTIPFSESGLPAPPALGLVSTWAV